MSAYKKFMALKEELEKSGHTVVIEDGDHILWDFDDVLMDEICPYLGEIELSAEDEEALKRRGKPRTTQLSDETPIQPTESAAFLALHRKRPTSGFSQKTEEEINKKRQELLEKLRKKKGGS
jgi:hypothetical protein